MDSTHAHPRPGYDTVSSGVGSHILSHLPEATIGERPAGDPLAESKPRRTDGMDMDERGMRGISSSIGDFFQERSEIKLVFERDAWGKRSHEFRDLPAASPDGARSAYFHVRRLMY